MVLTFSPEHTPREHGPFFASDARGGAVNPPPGKRAPFGLAMCALTPGNTGRLHLLWDQPPPVRDDLALRITTALDDREGKRLAVHTRSGRCLGELDLRYAPALQTFSLPLGPGIAAADLAGLSLHLTAGTSPLWLVAPGAGENQHAHAPRLIAGSAPTDPAAALRAHLRSPACQHTWGWMEGCVLDGLERLDAAYPGDGYRLALHAHLLRFFPPDGSLRAENARSEPTDDAIESIESTLMFAALARVWPDHPWLRRALAYWRAQAGSDGAVLDDAVLSAEGSYTIAYPMARLARLRGDPGLATQALRQLEIRRAHLWQAENLWLRWYPATGERTFRNWARGLTWHFLGSLRTAQELADDPRLVEVVTDVRRLAALALATQRHDGLWNCFVDDPHGTPETSGTAGLATALALAGRAGWIDARSARTAAARAWTALLPFIASDGRLGGVSQANRGGEELQRSGYRVLSAMGAGLAAQLHAALVGDHNPPPPPFPPQTLQA